MNHSMPVRILPVLVAGLLASAGCGGCTKPAPPVSKAALHQAATAGDIAAAEAALAAGININALGRRDRKSVV